MQSECSLWSVGNLQLLVCSKFTKNIFVTNKRQTIVWLLFEGNYEGKGFTTCPKI